MPAIPNRPTFASVFARRPAAPRRGLLPGTRVWVTLAAAAGLAAVVSLAPPLPLGVDTAAQPRAAALPVPLTSSSSTPVKVSPSPSGPAAASPATTTAPPAAPAQGGQQPDAPGAPRPSARPQPQPQPPAPAPAVPGRAIVGVQSRLCLSATVGSDGTALVLATCDNSPAQHWEAVADGTIRSVGLCMDAAWGSTADLTTVQVANCTGNRAQQFRLNPANDLVNVQADKCADVYNRATAPGSPVKLWPCNGQDNQKWFWR
ncbi:RICIN domain-containing protein [Longispora sp. NPDC051575]|uniref:RICIN domain-containing protein n=1 Tax=Longispora sp. NPDC051575 TaxID=3154943 RepID=UPI0034365842